MYIYARIYDYINLTSLIYDAYGNVQSESVTPISEIMTADEALELVRKERNQRLTDTDWTQLPDAPLSPEEVISWRIYRQKLRDLPAELIWNHTQWPVL